MACTGLDARINITELSIRRPVTTIMIFVSLVVIGLIAAFRLPLESQPETSPPFFFVQLPYQGTTPEGVECHLVRPVAEVTRGGSAGGRGAWWAGVGASGRARGRPRESD